jgi:hypothetical protein
MFNTRDGVVSFMHGYLDMLEAYVDVSMRVKTGNVEGSNLRVLPSPRPRMRKAELMEATKTFLEKHPTIPTTIIAKFVPGGSISFMNSIEMVLLELPMKDLYLRKQKAKSHPYMLIKELRAKKGDSAEMKKLASMSGLKKKEGGGVFVADPAKSKMVCYEDLHNLVFEHNKDSYQSTILQMCKIDEVIYPDGTVVRPDDLREYKITKIYDLLDCYSTLLAEACGVVEQRARRQEKQTPRKRTRTAGAGNTPGRRSKVARKLMEQEDGEDSQETVSD